MAPPDKSAVSAKNVNTVHQQDQRTFFIQHHMGGLEDEVSQQMRRDQRDQQLDRQQRHDWHAHLKIVAFLNSNLIWIDHEAS